MGRMKVSKRICFLSGPITGMPDYNRAAFTEAERLVQIAGYETINPNRIADHVFRVYRIQGKEPVWSDFMRFTVKKLCEADLVYQLEGWRQSRGAKVERLLAKYIFDLPCYEQYDDLPKEHRRDKIA